MRYGFYKIEMGLSEDSEEPVASLNIRNWKNGGCREVPASQIADLTHAMHVFVAKNEMSKGVSSDFDTFYNTTQIVGDLLCVYSELRRLGHPHYQRLSVEMNSVGHYEEDLYANALEEARAERNAWSRALTEHQNREPRLLFLSNMQILQCGTAISETYRGVHRSGTKEDIKDVFQKLYPYAWACFPESAAAAAGAAMDITAISAPVFTAYRVATRALDANDLESETVAAEHHLESVFAFISSMRNSLIDKEDTDKSSAEEEEEEEGSSDEDENAKKVRVVQAIGFTPDNLLYMLIEVFGDTAPHPSRTLYCERKTSTAEVQRFLACVEAFPALSYAVVGVNDLSVEPREVLLEWTAQALRPSSNRRKKKMSGGALSLVFTGRESLELFGFVPCKGAEDVLDAADYRSYSGSGVDFKRARERLGVETLAVYTGKPQTGKSYTIAKRVMKHQCPQLGLSVSEDFSPATFIRRYAAAAAKAEEGKDARRALHISIKVSPYGRVEAFGRFLCDVLLWGVLSDRRTGEMRSLCGRGLIALHVYVEVEEAPADDAEAQYSSAETIIAALPGLAALSTEWVRMSESGKSYVFGFLNSNAWKQYSLAARCYAEYHSEGDGNGSSSSSGGGMKSARKALETLRRQQRVTTTELSTFRKHLLGMTGSIAVEKRLARLYCARYKWLLEHLEFLARVGALDGPSQGLVSPAVYCEIIENEVAQLSARTIVSPTQHLNIYSEGAGTYVDFSAAGQGLQDIKRRWGAGARRAATALPQTITREEALRDPAALRSALSSGFSDRSVCDILLAQGYVLTPDFVLKLLLLNDFCRARQNVVLSGDTGSGKTELLTVFSRLANLRQSVAPGLLVQLGAALREFSGLARIALPAKGACEDELFETAHLLAEAVQLTYASSDAATREALLSVLASFAKAHEDVIEETPSMRTVARKANMSANDEGRNSRSSSSYGYGEGEENMQDVARNAVLDIVQPRLKGTFVKILMHQGVTAEAFRRKVAEVCATAEALTRVSDEATVVVFIDECTSTTIMSLVKEVIADHTLDGDVLPSNIMWIGAFNRNEVRSKASKAARTETGTGTGLMEEDFAVRPPPGAFDYAEIVFNTSEDPAQQETFLRNLLLLRQEQGAFRGFYAEQRQPGARVKELEDICSTVLYCHRYIERLRADKIKGSGSTGGDSEMDVAVLRRTHMSLRDLVQCVDLYVYFHKHPEFFVRDMTASTSSVERRRQWLHYNALVLATAVAYFYRLPAAYRGEFERRYPIRAIGGPWRAYGGLVAEAARQLYADTEVPSGVAPTAALLENLLCTVVCIDARVPLVIVGPPGCSKTLSFKIAVDNMKGAQSAHAAYRGLGHAHPFRYQCSPASTDAEVAGVFRSAAAEQRMHDANPDQGRQRCVVLLDEAGLPDERRSPLKVLHYALDHPQVSAVLLSNTPLDAAKTSRMAMVVQSRPGAADLRELAWGSICGCDASGNVRREAALGAIPYAEAERIKGAVEALCAAYEELTGSGSSGESKGEGWAKYAPVPDYFHLRDFVYMLRYIGREHRKMERFYGFTPAIIARALRRNFGGAASEAQFKAVLGLFFERLRQCLRRFDSPAGNGIDWSCPPGCVRKLRATTLDALRESIVDEHVADGEDPNTAPFRNALVLDPTESEASVALLFGLGLCSTESTVVVHVSDFEQDATEEARSRAVVQVKDAMAEGKTVILLNAMAISTSFYDVFNKNFDMVPVNSSSSSTAESNSSENRNDDRKKEAGKTHSGDLTELYKRYRYFANVAVGSYSRPCSVHPDFRVIAHVPLSELPHVPPAFLSRFEKYCLSLESALDAVRPSLAPAQQAALARLQADSEKMIAAARPDAFYGLVPGETLNSICLQAALTMKASSATATAATTTDAGGPVTVPLQEPFHVSEEMAVQDAQAGSPDGRPKAARMANFLLLQLGRPEGILGCDVFPDAYLREYVVRQEHFSVLRLLRHLLAPCNLATRPRKLCLFTRSCAELVQLYCDRALQAFVTAMAASGPLSPSTDTNNGGGGGMTFVSLAQFPSSKACEDCVERFKHSGNSALICIADVRECTNDQINFFRKKVDAHVPYDSASGCSKAVVLILHYPPEMQPLLHTARSSTSAIFLNGWQFAYVDSFGCSSNNSNSNSNTGGVSYVGQDAESTYDASSLSLSLLKSQEGEESNEERDSERDDGGSSGNGTSEERVELLLNPRMWLVRAFNLDVECSADDVRSLFAKMFADKVHAQVCNIQRSITQGKKPRLPLSGKFYRGSAKNGSGRPSAKVMARFLDDVLGAQSYIVDAVLAKFTAMWCGDLLHALVLEACRQISQGRILSGLLSVLQGALGTLLDPVVVLLLKAMCSNYALEPIARITLPDRAPEEAAAERAFVERILCNIGVPPKDVLVSMSLPAPGTAATTAATLTAKIHCLWPFPPYLPMFEVVLNRINELIAFIKIDGRAKPPCPYPALADELALRIRADWIGKAAKILKTSPHLLTLLKRDIVVFESRLYKVHVPQDVLDKDPAAGTLLDLCTDALEALTEGHKDSLAHLFLAADMKRQQLAFFVESVAKLQHIYPPVDMAALRGIFDFAALERNEPSPIENAVLRVGINGMWDSLCGACRGSSSGSNNEDSEAMLVSFEKTYRLVLAQMPSRKDLYAAGCIDTDALQLRADGVRLAELFLINVSPFKDEALPHLKVLVDLLGRRKESGPLSLKEAVEAAAAMAGDGVNAGPAAAFVRDVAHEFTECTKVPEEIPDSTRCDMSYFFSVSHNSTTQKIYTCFYFSSCFPTRLLVPHFLRFGLSTFYTLGSKTSQCLGRRPSCATCFR